MKRIKSVLVSLSLLLLLSSNPGLALADTNGSPKNETATIQQSLQTVYSARAAAVLDDNKAQDLRSYYPSDKLYNFEKSRVSLYKQMQSQSNQKIVGMTSSVTINNIDLTTPQEPLVTAYEWISYDWIGEGANKITSGIGVDHKVTFQKKGDSYIIKQDLYDEGRLTKVKSPDYKAPAEKFQLDINIQPTQPSPTQPVSPMVEPGATFYNRNAAANYSDSYAMSYNSSYYNYNPDGGDCANFASQSLRAGNAYFIGAYTQGSSNWWYNGSGSTPTLKSPISWRYCPSQRSFITSSWGSTTTLAGLSRGDLIYYDWGGDGVWDHVAIVTAFNGTNPLVNAHNANHYRVDWKLGGAARYSYVHINNYI